MSNTAIDKEREWFESQLSHLLANGYGGGNWQQLVMNRRQRLSQRRKGDV